MADIRVKLKNADGNILLPASLSDILAHGYGENASFDETTVKAELDKLLKLMTSGGASLDEAISALEELNTKSESSHYSSLVDLATFIENFMVDEDLAESVIDTWKELEEFLKGITDTDTLTGLLQESYNRLTAEKSAVAVGDDEKFITVTKTDEDTTYTNEKGETKDTTYPLYTITTNDIASATELANLESTVAGIRSDLSDYAKESDLEEVKETAENAASAAETAQATAESALSAADAATTAASAAQSTADSAVTAAAEALTAADKAQETADAKQDKLTPGDNITISDDNVISASNPDLSDLEEAVEAAQADATKALENAATAQSAAEGAQSTADEAAEAAATAEQDAQTALAAAETADSKAAVALSAADTALSTAEEAQAAAEAALSDVDDLKETVESLGDSKQDKLTAEAPISISDDNKISIDLSGYLTTSDAESTYATQGALSDVSTVANGAAAQATTNADAIEQLQATVVTGVYYEEIENN